MTDLLCPFSAPLVKQDVACTRAREIIRRGGAEIACQDVSCHTRCSRLHNQIKIASLADMDQQDDLLTLPHSVLVKIQYGALLGIQGLLDSRNAGELDVPNVAGLIDTAETTFNGLDNMPLTPVCETIRDYKITRRRKK